MTTQASQSASNTATTLDVGDRVEDVAHGRGLGTVWSIHTWDLTAPQIRVRWDRRPAGAPIWDHREPFDLVLAPPAKRCKICNGRRYISYRGRGAVGGRRRQPCPSVTCRPMTWDESQEVKSE